MVACPQYAPSIREHNGKFFVYVPNYREGMIVATADRSEGPWTTDWLRKPDGTPWMETRITDPCPIWCKEGAFLVLSRLNYQSGWILRLSDDGMRLLEDPDDKAAGFKYSPYASTEGNKFYARNGYVYIFHIEFRDAKDGSRQKGSYVWRSKSVYGPYEERYIPMTIPGQGGFVDTLDGKWYLIAQYNTPQMPIGRCHYICPVEWVDDWPVPGLPISLDGGSCSQMWESNHVAEEGAWDFASRPGWLRIKGRKSEDFWKTPNTASKRVIQYEDATKFFALIDGSQLKVGERAGIALFNGKRKYAICGVARKGGKLVQFHESGGKMRYGEEVPETSEVGWTVRGADCTPSFGTMTSIGGGGYRGINAGFYTTGTADFKLDAFIN